MKNVAKCDTWCELQNPVNHRVFERKLRPRDPPEGTPASRAPPCPDESPSRDVAADGNVRKSGDAGGGLGKSYLFCLTACPPWKRLSRRQGKSAKRIRNFGKRIGSEGWARGSRPRTRRLPADCSSCRRTARAAHAARAGRRVPAGGRAGNDPLGGLPRATNSRLRTGTDKGNPTV
ncbi:hypothetical protein FCM35_KLT06424 [Carex littledalei]|uniref:Uncharacterized protein n=1 Tax=Carex littledalei TaxID=544730 RepID=A0A833QZY4_9POAL|nr:hypothetical protein FCM35_KLT06424 [Carex littledalei]